jgi:hypothetical protein
MLFAERCPSLICGCKGTKNNCKLKKNAIIFARCLIFCFFLTQRHKYAEFLFHSVSSQLRIYNNVRVKAKSCL